MTTRPRLVVDNTKPPQPPTLSLGLQMIFALEDAFFALTRAGAGEPGNPNHAAWKSAKAALERCTAEAGRG